MAMMTAKLFEDGRSQVVHLPKNGDFLEIKWLLTRLERLLF